MPCWAIPAVVTQSAAAAVRHVVAVARMGPHVGRPARRLIRHHLGPGHRTARAIWRTSLVCVPGAPLAAIFGPQRPRRLPADHVPRHRDSDGCRGRPGVRVRASKRPLQRCITWSATGICAGAGVRAGFRGRSVDSDGDETTPGRLERPGRDTWQPRLMPPLLTTRD